MTRIKLFIRDRLGGAYVNVDVSEGDELEVREGAFRLTPAPKLPTAVSSVIQVDNRVGYRSVFVRDRDGGWSAPGVTRSFPDAEVRAFIDRAHGVWKVLS